MAAAGIPWDLEPHFELCRVRPERVDGKGVGMVCREPVQKGEELLRVPLSRCWTTAAARASEELAPLGAELLEAISDESLLALHMLAVRSRGAAAEAARHAHIQVLEATECETLMDWGPEDLQLLAGSKWAVVPPQQLEDFRLEFTELQEIAGDFLAGFGIDLEGFMWAHRMLMTRKFHLTMEDGPMLMVLAPGVDMFNHSAEAPVGDEDVNLARGKDGELSLAVRAYRDYAEGEEAVYSYRGASNGRLLAMGGFVLPGNPFDAVELEFQLPACSSGAQPLFTSLAEGLRTGVQAPGSLGLEARSEFLEPLPDGSFALHVQLTGEDVAPVLERVLAFFRLVRLCRGSAVPSPQELAASDGDKATRVAVLTQLREHLRQLLAQYPTSLEEDERALRALEEPAAGAAAAEPPQRRRRRANALHVVVGEKRIFARAMAWLESSIDALVVKPSRPAK